MYVCLFVRVCACVRTCMVYFQGAFVCKEIEVLATCTQAIGD